MREDAEVLERIKRDIGIQRFASQYLQQLAPDGGNAIKREWLQFYDQHPSQRAGDSIVQSWDGLPELVTITTSQFVPPGSNERPNSICLTCFATGLPIPIYAAKSSNTRGPLAPMPS